MGPKSRRIALEPGSERSVKTTIELPEDVWRAAKIRALDEYSDLRSVVTAALTAYLRVPSAGGQDG
jgi:hypothetical protein